MGYDYATKKPLEDFVLQASSNGMLLQDPMRANEPLPLVSTLPVVGILGRQHQVDGIFHDLFTDLVYIFTGMKFYAFEAAEFKVSQSAKQNLLRTYSTKSSLEANSLCHPHLIIRMVLLKANQRVNHRCIVSMSTF